MSDIIYPWQQKSWSQFLQIRQQRRLPHALLLTGPPDTGLSHFARAIARAMLCQHDQPPCDRCRDCQLSARDHHPDLFLVRNERQTAPIRIDQIRDMQEFILLTSFAGNIKIVLIDPADMMNRHAVNALLKTLEEPPQGGHFLLVSQGPLAALPVMLRSRCQRFTVNPEINEDSLRWLKSQLDGHTASSQRGSQDIEDILRLANHRPLLAVSLYTENRIAEREGVVEQLLILLEGKVDPLMVSSYLHGMGSRAALACLLQIIHDMTRYQLAVDQQQIAIWLPIALQKHAERLKLIDLVDCYRLILRQYQLLFSPLNLNTMGILDIAMIQMHHRLVEYPQTRT